MCCVVVVGGWVCSHVSTSMLRSDVLLNHSTLRQDLPSEPRTHQFGQQASQPGASMSTSQVLGLGVGRHVYLIYMEAGNPQDKYFTHWAVSPKPSHAVFKNGAER